MFTALLLLTVGTVSALAEIAAIPAGYPVWLMTSFFLYDQASTPAEPLLNSFVNADGDERIDLEAELRPAIELFIRNYPAFVRGVEASYALADLIAEYRIPTLLHGERDGWVPLTSAESIAAANEEMVTLLSYPELGHALSPVESVVADVFGGNGCRTAS
jgi:pimeloyl-ACP methyl ester carboxylesterase